MSTYFSRPIFFLSPLLFALAIFLCLPLHADWAYDGGVLTATSGESVGMKLTAQLSGTNVTVKGISDRGSLTAIDLRGVVTNAADGTALAIVKIDCSLKFSGLVDLYLPDAVTEITGSFDGCSTLKHVEPLLPSRLKTCPSELFRNCSSLTGDVVMACAEMTEWKRCMFLGTKITSVDFTKSGITTIRDWVCYNCSCLTNVTPFLPDRVSSVDTSAFGECKKLRGDFRMSNANIKTIPGGFLQNTAITSVDLGVSPIETINSSAFYGCGSITNFTPFLPPTVKSLGSGQSYTFRYCGNIANPLVLSNPNLKTLPWGCFQYCSKIPSVDLTGCGVTYIDQYCFNSDYALKDVKPFLPDSVTYCGQSCFTDTGVTNFLTLTHFKAETFPSFIRNSSVCGLDLTGSYVSNICNSCFQGVPLRRVILPESLMAIEAEAFRSVYHAKGLFFRGPPPNMALRTFILNSSMAGAYVLPKGKHAPAWREYIASEPRLVSALSAAEKKSFAIADLKPPTKKLNMNKDNGEVKPQYLCWWWPHPTGLTVIIK